MTAINRVTAIYKSLRKTYGKEHADDQIINIMYMEQITGDATYDEMARLYEELTK